MRHIKLDYIQKSTDQKNSNKRKNKNINTVCINTGIYNNRTGERNLNKLFEYTI